MSKRELIIVVIAALVGIYGILDYLILPRLGSANKSETSLKARQEIEAFSSDAMAQLASTQKLEGPPAIKEIIPLAEGHWPRDPFGTAPSDSGKPDEDPGEDPDQPDLVYSGFMQAGDHILAVINNMEYSIGELVKETGLTLSQITPAKVVLKNSSQREIILELQEN
ncbi:MAG: general secretion pathway protein GspB [Desulfobacterales bacterium]|nr:general secretion pathway protein GspB [Desulfobacterales bacterium]